MITFEIEMGHQDRQVFLARADGHRGASAESRPVKPMMAMEVKFPVTS
jgi:hypothetical protein